VADAEKPEKKEIFRKVALERLSSPEQLDLVMQVTNTRSWIALTGLALLLTVAVIWGFIGSVPTKVQAQGVLIRAGGVFDVYAQGTGQVSAVLVKEGDAVAVGQVVARVAQPALEREIASARARLDDLRAQHKELSTYTSRDQSLRTDTEEMQEAKLKDTITFAQERITALRDQVANEETLLGRGLITKQSVLQTQQALYGAQDLLESARNELKQLPIAQLSTRTQGEQSVIQSQHRINETERQIELMVKQSEQLSSVESPYAGHVVEVKKDPGGIVGLGTPLMSLELLGHESAGLQVIAYVPPGDGKNVERNMTVQVSPTTAPREEYGFLTGKVSYVSLFPSTPDGMMRVLGNPTLVQGLAAAGPPFATYIELSRDAASVSGYHWSSYKGNSVPVNSGTMCTINITVRERRPVELVIPMLRQALGL
jgi:HlyD family secretion protein